MKKLLNSEPLLIPIIIILAAFTSLSWAGKTIAPFDLYSSTDRFYDPTSIRPISNPYLTDIVDVYLPWKFYLTEYDWSICSTATKLGTRTIVLKGVTLPDRFCYPIFAVRSNIFFDSFFAFRKAFGFFTSYNMSYGLFLAWLFVSSYFFFYLIFKTQDLNDRRKVYTTILALFLTLSFPVARELQYDGPAQGLAWLFWSLSFFKIYMGRLEKKFLFMSMVFLILAAVKSTLQGIGLFFLFWFLFNGVWYGKELKILGLKRLFGIAGALVLSVILVGVYYQDTFVIFFNNSSQFLSFREVSIQNVFMRKFWVLVCSVVHFFYGPFFSSFDTLDFFKVLGPLKREYLSYDGASFYVHPILAFGILVGISSCKSKAFNLLLKFFVFSVIVSLSPLADLLYFRFLQWWVLVAAVLSFGFLLYDNSLSKFQLRRGAYVILIYCLGLAVLYIVISHYRVFIANTLQAKSFDSSSAFFSDYRIHKFLRRLIFWDRWAVVFAISFVSILYFFRKEKFRFVVIILTFSGLGLNIFFYNPVQSPVWFSKLRENIAQDPEGKNVGPGGRRQAENINLYNNLPVNSIWESMYIDFKDLDGQKPWFSVPYRRGAQWQKMFSTFTDL